MDVSYEEQEKLISLAQMLPTTTICSCKGIRTCVICESSKTPPATFLPNTIYVYCDACRQAVRMPVYESNGTCPHHSSIGDEEIAFPLDGIYLVADFVTENEENELIYSIDNDIWIASQSGRHKQDFGVKINFKKQSIKTNLFTGLPIYARSIVQRLQSHRLLADFQSVELCNLDYRRERGSHIDGHTDDTWIWGERLVTVNLLSDTILSLTHVNQHSDRIVYVALPRRWLVVLFGDARYDYKHAIQRQHIQERRVAVTLREFTRKYEKFYAEHRDVYENVQQIARRFTGISVGRLEQLLNSHTTVVEKMDVDHSSSFEEQLKQTLQDTFQAKIQTLEMFNSTTYLVTSQIRYLVKLFPQSHVSTEQLQSIDGTLLASSICEYHTLAIDLDQMPVDERIGRFLAQCRMVPGKILSSPMDEQWWNQQYALVITKKKDSLPLLLSNLFTCQQQISSSGWNNTESFHSLLDLASSFVLNIDSFSSHVKSCVKAYEEVLPLANIEIDLLDTFVRLQLVFSLIHHDQNDQQLKLLETLSSDVFFVRNLVR